MPVYKETNIVVAGATVIFAGGPVGYTRDALTIAREPNDRLIIDDIQQIAGVAGVRKTKQGFQIKANLYEFTLENVKTAFGINASIDTIDPTVRSLNIDVSGDYPEGELIIMGKGPSNVARTFKFYSAKLIDCGEITVDAYGATVLPVTWQVIKHPDYTELGTITEEYVPSSTVVD